ncbi:MAG: YaiI/YqxD family protein [Rhodospirillales bacterium]
MVDIYVDGDACPVKKEVLRVAQRHRLTVHLVSNSALAGTTDPLVHRVMVDAGADAADDWIAAHICGSDVAVTGDIALAARCLQKGARALAPTGKPFTDDSIGMALAMRDLNAQLRDSGMLRGGGSGFTAKDRSRFLQALENTVQALQRAR